MHEDKFKTIYSKKYKENFDKIDWTIKKQEEKEENNEEQANTEKTN